MTLTDIFSIKKIVFLLYFTKIKQATYKGIQKLKVFWKFAKCIVMKAVKGCEFDKYFQYKEKIVFLRFTWVENPREKLRYEYKN